MSYSNVDTVIFESFWDATHICLTVVIREHHLGLDDFRSINQLLLGHRVGLVARQESYVDVLDS